MRAVTLLTLVCATISFAAQKPLVLIDAEPAVARLLSKAISRTYEPVVLTRSVGERPSEQDVRDACIPQSAVAIVHARQAASVFEVRVLNGNDGATLESIRLTEKKKVTALPPKLGPAVVAALKNAQAPQSKSAPVAAEEPPEKKAEPPEEKAEDAPPQKPAKKEEAKIIIIKKREEPEAPPPAKAEAKEPEPEKQPEPAGPVAHGPLPTLRASVGALGFNREFAAAGDPLSGLGSYGDDFHGGVVVDAQLFPAASSGTFAGHIGLYGHGEFGVGVSASAKGPDGDRHFPAESVGLRFGGIIRIPVASAEIDIHGGYSSRFFGFAPYATDGKTLRPNVPTVTYQGVRFGPGFRIAFGKYVNVDLSAAAIIPLSLGEIGTAAFYPKATAFGFEGGGGIAFRLLEGLELRLGFEGARYLLTLNPQPDGPFKETTAGDQYLTGSASLGWAL